MIPELARRGFLRESAAAASEVACMARRGDSGMRSRRVGLA
ncbi:hypothetical protein DB30_05548 [Enhygromyxa salina]|uniref:Uncharacterized protein n=1 Tax=Enhygromyxa salina TaxID=215803 RepID=A0A0C2D107_9BACT|nr:hypothetical protein [Enhygromyxa salina]KIG15525.1 hypothetical protein DB30_05548 [Enhygromyxa salina]